MRLLQEYLRLLIQHGIDPDSIRNDATTPVHMQIAKFDDHLRQKGLMR
jgi:hypothetical protein